MSVVVTGGAVFYRWAMQPVSVTPTTSAKASEALSPKTTILETAYYTVVIPDAYTVRERSDESVGSVLSSLMATKGSQDGGQLAITVAPLPQGGLSEVADIRLRQEYPERYESATLEGVPTDARVYRSKQSNEMSVFWPQGGRYAAIVLRDGGGGPDQTGDQLTYMLRTWHWL